MIAAVRVRLHETGIPARATSAIGAARRGQSERNPLRAECITLLDESRIQRLGANEIFVWNVLKMTTAARKRLRETGIPARAASANEATRRERSGRGPLCAESITHGG